MSGSKINNHKQQILKFLHTQDIIGDTDKISLTPLSGDGSSRDRIILRGSTGQ